MRAMIEAYKKVQRDSILSDLEDYFGERLEWAIRYRRIGRDSMADEEANIGIGIAQSMLMVQDKWVSWDVQMDLESAIRRETERDEVY
jgi:hypothetical protein